VVAWHGDGHGVADHLLEDGTVVARCDRDLALLHLHHGDRRVSLAEARALAGAA
jgi:hypothetical protein